MLKGSQIIALALTLTSLLVGISTEIAYAKQSTGDTVVTGGDYKYSPYTDSKCGRKPCPVIGPHGNTPHPNRGVPVLPVPSFTSTTDLKLNQQLETVPAAAPEVKLGGD